MFPHLEIQAELRRVLPDVLPGADVTQLLVRPCLDPKFGDYQVTALMGLAKVARANPRQLAESLRSKADLSALCVSVEVAGAGFLNFRLHPGTLARAVQSGLGLERPFFQKAAEPRTVVVDFSSPNVAKPMHVGHIRSTVLGDCLARVLRLLGHRVVTDNHIGDWGTQFGKLLVGWKTRLDRERLGEDPLGEMERLYKQVNADAEVDPELLALCRQELVRLQAGDEENLGIWREMIAISQRQFDTIYGRLGVVFDHVLGESFYNPRLGLVVEELVRLGIARESDGARCVFSDGLVPPKEDPFLIQKDGAWVPNPCLVQKSDGAANYATTDLATLEYRLATWGPDEIVYVTDGRQQLHFRQIFGVFRRWRPESRVRLSHVWFGSILGEDGKPFRTRSGETVKLADLLDEAQERAYAVVTAKSPDLAEGERREIARVIGVGAVKYADLLPNRQSDYVFSWDKMLALNGNTAVYLLYACARVSSVVRKSGLAVDQVEGGSLVLAAREELALARQLLNFGFVLEAVAEEHRPNYLCNYLYDLAGLFAAFWENCPVLSAGEEEKRSRLMLCLVAGRVLRTGLEALGIEPLEQM